jgi:D-3-phosphoglycerate dehydrogenase
VSRFKVVVSDQVFPSVDLERRILAEIDADLVVASGTRDEVLEIARDADAILNTYLPFDADAIERLERCKIIARYGIGVDNIDLDAARRKGIVVTNVPDYCVEEVATHTLALILAVARKVVTADRLVRDGEWTIEPLRPLRRLSELTVGLLGYGKIARRVAAALETLGAEMVVYDPYVQPGPDTPRLVDLGELLSSADILSIHAPLTPETRGMIDREALAKMKPGSYLVNTSRGPLVVLEDLLEALREGRLAGAALDVFENEPVNPAVIADVPNLIATPHMAYYSEEALEESQRKAATQVVKVLTGQEPDYRVA